MQIIQFKENQKAIWNKFIAENNSESFLQAWEWGEFQSKIERKMWRIGIIEDDLFNENETSKSKIQNHKFQINSIPQCDTGQNLKLIAVALIVKYNLSFGRSYFYCPRGPVVSRKPIKSKVHKVLFNEIKKIAEKEKSLFLKIDPPMGVEQNFPLFGKEGLGEVFKKSPNEVQPKNTLILDITRSEEDLLKEMKPKTRYNIRLAGKKELRIKKYELRVDNKIFFKEKFEKFWGLVEETSARDNFKSHNKNYYWKMLENLGRIQKAPQPCGTMELANDLSGENKTKNNTMSCRLRAKLYLAEYENKIVAANIVLYFGDLAVYLHGASSNKHRNIMAPYLLQWRQIMDAKKAGCKRYDFWGIKKSQKFVKPIKSKVNDWSGITRFKKGFGGEEKNYIGAYDLIFRRWEYKLYNFAKKIKNRN